MFRHEGGDIEHGLNVDYMLDTLRCLPNVEQVECGSNGFNDAMLLTIPGEARYKYVQMPMKL